jgi:hypothetical protein
LIYSVPVNGKTWYGVVYPMCPIRRLVVHHTWSLPKRSRDQRPEKVYGDNFAYNEIIATTRFYEGVLHLLGLSVHIASFLFSPVRPCFPELMFAF